MYSPFRHIGSISWLKRPIHLTFFLTRRCNARCPFCFYLKTDKPAVMLFPTNGLLPELIKDRTQRILKQCPKSIIAVKLSMDGLYHEHDALRNTPGSFEKTLATYHLLKRLLDTYPNFELGINTVFCSENQDRMDRIIDYVNTLKCIKTHTISLIRGNLAESSFKDVDYRKYHRAIERLENNLKDNVSSIYRFRGAKIKAAQDILQRRLINQTMLDRKRLVPCYAGRLNLVLTESGNVYPCEILSDSFGNVKDYDYDLRKVSGSDTARKIIRSIMTKKCYCTHECYFMTNILFNPRLYPALARVYIQL